MLKTPERFPWHAAIGLVVVLGVIAAASCQSARRLRPPYHQAESASTQPLARARPLLIRLKAFALRARTL